MNLQLDLGRLTGPLLVFSGPYSIGMPGNDGDTAVWYSVVLPRGESLGFEHRRLVYDYSAAAAAMREAGLSEGYARALETGLWASLDSLPARERAAAGRTVALDQAPCTGS
jgi:hypothetical protein